MDPAALLLSSYVASHSSSFCSLLSNTSNILNKSQMLFETSDKPEPLKGIEPLTFPITIGMLCH